MAFSSSQEENIAAYGGYGGGMGGSWAMIILIVVVLWVLFSRDGRRDGDGYGGGHPYPALGYGGGCGCGPCVQPTFKDESNWEQEDHLQKKICQVEKEIWETDRDVWKTACETQKEISCDGQKTRALIEQNYIQDLRDKIGEQNSMIQTMKSEAFTERKIDQVLGSIGAVRSDIDKQFCRTDAEIARLSCELPKRPPVFSECVTPNTHDINCREGFGRERFERESPRRGRCDFDECCGF